MQPPSSRSKQKTHNIITHNWRRVKALLFSWDGQRKMVTFLAYWCIHNSFPSTGWGCGGGGGDGTDYERLLKSSERGEGTKERRGSIPNNFSQAFPPMDVLANSSLYSTIHYSPYHTTWQCFQMHGSDVMELRSSVWLANVHTIGRRDRKKNWRQIFSRSQGGEVMRGGTGGVWYHWPSVSVWARMASKYIFIIWVNIQKQPLGSKQGQKHGSDELLYTFICNGAGRSSTFTVQSYLGRSMAPCQR